MASKIKQTEALARMDSLVEAAKEACLILSALYKAFKAEDLSSPAMRQRIKAGADALGDALKPLVTPERDQVFCPWCGHACSNEGRYFDCSRCEVVSEVRSVT